jgi:predicted Rossmann-fold nucleotide-binding protein
MDELFESLTLIQTGKVRNFPVVLFGRSYWQGMLEWLKGVMLAGGNIHAADLDLLVTTDSPAEAVSVIRDCYDATCTEAHQKSEAARMGGMRRDLREVRPPGQRAPNNGT